MNRVASQKNSGLWALDAALLLLGLMVLMMVFRLTRFDDPRPLFNAWSYLLGVPTILIATSMITRVLANDVVEKSIQLGFLLSVGLHLLLVLFSVNVVLLNSVGSAEKQKLAVVAASNKAKSPQYFQPTNFNRESRPDYLKPVQTEQAVVKTTIEPPRRPDESAKLNIDIVNDEIKPMLQEKPFIKPRKEASPSQPSISSTAEHLARPDLRNTLDGQRSMIEAPRISSSQTAPSQDMQAAATELNRIATPIRNSIEIADMADTKLETKSRASQGPKEGIRQSTTTRDEKNANRELEKSLSRSGNDLTARPSSFQRGSSDTFDKPTVANVPVPKLGTSSSRAVSNAYPERNTDIQSRTNVPRATTRQSVGVANFQAESKLELSLGKTLASAGIGSVARNETNSSLEDNSFLSDPRLVMNDGASGRFSGRIPGDSLAAPAANQPVPTIGTESPRIRDYNSNGDLGLAMPTRSDINKSALGTRSPSTTNSSSAGGPTSSLSATINGPSKAMGGDSFVAPVLDVPRKGLDRIKREIALPEIRDAEMTFDRLRRPETGGPKIANSAVPIPAAAFSQRLNRNREQEDSADLGPLGPQTELAIESGLSFLAKYQRTDGSWHLEDFGDSVDIRSDTAATALSLLSFQGAGYTHRQFKYESVCERALTWMIQNQRPNGDLYVRTDPKSDGNSWLYSHAIASLALCEAYGMTQDESIKKNAQSAIDFLIQSQDPQGGGWRYQPKIGSDTSVTGWCMMALKSAELSGLSVSKESYDGITKWLEGSQASETKKYLYRYNWQAADSPTTRHGRLPTPVMTSVGLLMRLYLGWRRDNPDMKSGTDWLIERPPAEGTVQNPQRDTYYWYYATQVMFHMGGERWKKWYGTLYPMLIRTQSRDGDYLGSWEPNGRIPDAWGRFGGRLYVTTLNLLSLEVYYRHLPIYEATAD